jgi:hypothetical protein
MVSDQILNAKKVRPAEIHPQVCEVYGENAMSDGMMRWCTTFSEGRTNVHDDYRNGRPSLVTANLLDQVNENIRGNRRFNMPGRLLAAERFSSDESIYNQSELTFWTRLVEYSYFYQCKYKH